MKKFGIIGAMDIEIAILKKEMESNGSLKQITKGRFNFFEGKIAGKDVVVVKSGVGKVNAACCAQTLISNFNVDCVINSGIAGAMASELQILDIVVSTDAVYHDMDATNWGYKPGEIPQSEISNFIADSKLVDLAVKAFNESEYAKEHKIMKGRVASGDQFIADAALKAKINENFKPACVEMEGAAIAHACWLNNVPFMILRCLSDNASDVVGTTNTFNEQTAADESAAIMLGLLKTSF